LTSHDGPVGNAKSKLCNGPKASANFADEQNFVIG